MFSCFMLKLGNVGDLLQLVNENNCIIKVVRNPGNFTEYSIETINEFVDIYGINPNQIPDYKGLAGDTSDRLKGVGWHWA